VIARASLPADSLDPLMVSLSCDGVRSAVALAKMAWRRGEHEESLRRAFQARGHLDAAERIAPHDPRVVEARQLVEDTFPARCKGGCNRLFAGDLKRADEDLRICRGCRARLGNGDEG
jgi:hypothetical protein